MFHQIEQTPWGGHHHIRTTAQRHHLRIDGDAAKHHGDARWRRQRRRQFAQHTTHLGRQLPGGYQHQGLHIPLAGQASGLALEEAKKAGAVFAYGNFITILVNFILLAFIIFMMVKQINRLKREEPAAAPEAPPEEVTLLREIRDSLKR